MSTSANIIFASNYHKCDEENLDKCISQEFDYIKHGNQIYIHSDGYPEHILKFLNGFFKLEGAKKRRDDANYLSAWFVTYYCIFNRFKFMQEEFKDNYQPNVEDIYTCKDFRGIGLHNGEESETNYTYVITNSDITSFNVWIYIGNVFDKLVSLSTKSEECND